MDDWNTIGDNAVHSSSSSSSSSRVGQEMRSDARNGNPSSHRCDGSDGDDDDADERTIVLRTMKALETSVYKRPRAQCLPEMFRGLWRKQIVEWMYILVKYCKLNLEATAAAVYYLDVAAWASSTSSSSSSSSLVQTSRDYQLCAMTALHLALKVYDSPTVRVVKLSSLVKLGNGQFTEDDVIQKEHDLVRALRWRINPPTANCFFQRYLELVPFFDEGDDEGDDDECGRDIDPNGVGGDKIHGEENDEDDDQLGPIPRRRRERLRTIEEIASEFIEVAMAHDQFLSVPASVIGYAALLSAMELTMDLRQHESSPNEPQQQQQQQTCQFDYDWVAFLHNMKTVAEMGDVVNDDDRNGNGTTSLSRLVRRTKTVLERIVRGLPLPPDDEDDDDDFHNAAFAKTKLLCDKNNNNSHNGDDDAHHGNHNDTNNNNNNNNTFGEFAKLSTEVSTSPPRSPTSTI